MKMARLDVCSDRDVFSHHKVGSASYRQRTDAPRGQSISGAITNDIRTNQKVKISKIST